MLGLEQVPPVKVVIHRERDRERDAETDCPDDLGDHGHVVDVACERSGEGEDQSLEDGEARGDQKGVIYGADVPEQCGSHARGKRVVHRQQRDVHKREEGPALHPARAEVAG